VTFTRQPKSIRRALRKLFASASGALLLNYGVKALEFNACIFSSKPPVYRGMLGISFCLPGGNVLCECLFAGDASVGGLTAEDTQFTLGDIEPTVVFGRVVDLQSIPQLLRLGQ